MPKHRTKRALILTGAGASIPFGAPSTSCLTQSLQTRILADSWMRQCESDRVWSEIFDKLANYLHGGADAVNFEMVYHCAHELLSTFEPTSGAVNEFRPILVPFITRRSNFTEESLRQLVIRMVQFIYEDLSAASKRLRASLDPLAEFLARLREHHVTRIYTTNYDDFALQAAPDLYTGYDTAPIPGAKRLDHRTFWQATDRDCICHVHGSVHLSFGDPLPGEPDLGELYWYDDRSEAAKAVPQTGSDDLRPDGGSTVVTPLVTGLDKLSHLQRQPFTHYYASLARDAMNADIVFVIGSGLGDLHLNTWLKAARRRKQKPPLILVDQLSLSELARPARDWDRKFVPMIHDLLMPLTDGSYKRYGSAWSLDSDQGYALWEQGFYPFLNASDELQHVMEELASARPRS